MLEFFTNFAEALATGSGHAVLWLYLFAFVAILVVVVAFTYGLGVFLGIGVIGRHCASPFMVERRKDNTRRGWSLYCLRWLRQGSAALAVYFLTGFVVWNQPATGNVIFPFKQERPSVSEYVGIHDLPTKREVGRVIVQSTPLISTKFWELGLHPFFGGFTRAKNVSNYGSPEFVNHVADPILVKDKVAPTKRDDRWGLSEVLQIKFNNEPVFLNIGAFKGAKAAGNVLPQYHRIYISALDGGNMTCRFGGGVGRSFGRASQSYCEYSKDSREKRDENIRKSKIKKPKKIVLLAAAFGACIGAFYLNWIGDNYASRGRRKVARGLRLASLYLIGSAPLIPLFGWGWL
jgi:hypothetical protein